MTTPPPGLFLAKIAEHSPALAADVIRARGRRLAARERVERPPVGRGRSADIFRALGVDLDADRAAVDRHRAAKADIEHRRATDAVFALALAVDAQLGAIRDRIVALEEGAA